MDQPILRRQASLLVARINALTEGKKVPSSDTPISAVLTTLMKHGGAYSLTNPDVMATRVAALAPTMTSRDVDSLVRFVQDKAASFFYHLVNEPYTIHSDLISYIVFPHEGTTYTALGVDDSNPQIPAPFTFVGQFIDHDLTMNALNLFDTQTGIVADGASPLIDLDSVYGPRAKSAAAFDQDGRFVLQSKSQDGFTWFDLPRDNNGVATIADGRNDENQLILQVHLLLMRVHNKLIDSGLKEDAAQRETIFNWQSVVLNDYLPRVCDADTLKFVLTEIQKPDFGQLKHKPMRDLGTGELVVSMPHEFAIGFRMGHSMLRDSYRLNPGNMQPIPLFDNRTTDVFKDLRGSKPLRREHVIDWPFFIDVNQNKDPSNLIDSKVTAVVFDLPESAIPDDIKYIGNLPQRNLIRSTEVGLAAGEAVARFFGVPVVDKNQIEPNPANQSLFEHEGEFLTPLWYYVLKEAELTKNKGKMLGELGTRIISEVIAGGIYYNPQAFVHDQTWKSRITSNRTVTLLDLAKFVST